MGIPWRLAFALQADGWWLRSDIIWAKPSAMPESARDRPTVAHEYIFLLTKQARYYFDAEAIRESSDDEALYRMSKAIAVDGVLSTPESAGQLQFAVQGLREGSGDGIPADPSRKTQPSRGGPAVSGDREGTGSQAAPVPLGSSTPPEDGIQG